MDDDLFNEDDSDITKVGRVDKDLCKIHKETYQFNMDYDSKKGYYSTRLGIDLKAIDLGEYTLVFEMYFNETKIDKNEVVVDAQGPWHREICFKFWEIGQKALKASLKRV